jgi:hypothetical protein
MRYFFITCTAAVDAEVECSAAAAGGGSVKVAIKAAVCDAL